MQWFFALNDKSTEWFADMVKAAVLSARTHTSLEPHCLFDGAPNELTQWLQSQNVVLHFTSVDFRADLFAPTTLMANEGSLYSPDHAAGAFLRLIAYRFARRGKPFLYTDCDVIFLNNAISDAGTFGIAAVPELEGAASFNSGVMLIDQGYMAARAPALMQFIADRYYYSRRLSSYDQHFLNVFFSELWEPLPSKFNWRPSQGINPDASIVHFHGPKPHRIAAIMSGDASEEERGHVAIIDAARDGYAHWLERFDCALRG